MVDNDNDDFKFLDSLEGIPKPQPDIKFDDYLCKKWLELFANDQEQIFKSSFDDMKLKKIGKYYAYFSQSIINKPNQLINKDIDFLQAQNQKAAPVDGYNRVYQEFDESKFNFNQIDPRAIMFYVDLEEEEIISKEKEQEKDDQLLLHEATNSKQKDHNFENDNNLEMTQKESHPVVINAYPVCPFHSILPLFLQESLPQVIGQEIIQLMLQIFKISGNPALRIGYNSMGAYCSVNHLHFQMLYANELFPLEKGFPLEFAPMQLVHKSTLQHINNEINMFSVGIKISQVDIKQYPMTCLIIEANKVQCDEAEIFNSIAFAVGTVTNILLDMATPHNLIFADLGRKVYIIPRKYQNDNKRDNDIRMGFLECAGIVICRNEQFYNTINEQEFISIMKENACIEQELFDQVKAKLIGILQSKFKEDKST